MVSGFFRHRLLFASLSVLLLIGLLRVIPSGSDGSSAVMVDGSVPVHTFPVQKNDSGKPSPVILPGYTASSTPLERKTRDYGPEFSTARSSGSGSGLADNLSFTSLTFLTQNVIVLTSTLARIRFLCVYRL